MSPQNHSITGSDPTKNKEYLIQNTNQGEIKQKYVHNEQNQHPNTFSSFELRSSIDEDSYKKHLRCGLVLPKNEEIQCHKTYQEEHENKTFDDEHNNILLSSKLRTSIEKDGLPVVSS